MALPCVLTRTTTANCVHSVSPLRAHSDAVDVLGKLFAKVMMQELLHARLRSPLLERRLAVWTLFGGH